MKKIIAYSRITDTLVILNGKPCEITFSCEIGPGRLAEIYRFLEVNYPKFFKMDNFSKAGFLASEMVLRSLHYDMESPDESTSVVFANRSSSLDNDKRFQETISRDDYFPSPAVFVYTLPNIVTGEVAIRNKIMGETSFFILESFDAEKMMIFADWAFSSAGTRRVLCGWTEYLDGHSDLLVMMVEKESDKGFDFNKQNINNIYRT
ncbi:MAG TPA: hypothetical protein PLM86_01795 [Bacteroidales bacterium]|nr:hypothetical protein [Bacteroidales bacterium]HOR10706.1 hypothetical protein [Bacteroidales bacterium]